MAIAMMIMFCIAGALLLALVPNLLWLIGWTVGKVMGHSLSYSPFGWTAIGIVIFFWLLMGYGFFVGRWNMEVNEVDFVHHDVPDGFDGFRIVHISDLHLSTFDDSPAMLNRCINAINALSPDLVCFTGDLVTVGKSEAEPYADILRGVRSRYGVVAVLGNHDMLIYGNLFPDETARIEAVDGLVRFEQDVLGWNLLRNQSMEIASSEGSKITIIGVDNHNGSKQGFRTIDCGDLPKAVAGTDGFRILLTHDPSHWTSEVVGSTDIQLTLSGHTHAAQFRLFGWTPSSLMFEHTDGRYDIGDQSLYVNVGMGCTVPFRLGVPAEITLITLHQDN